MLQVVGGVLPDEGLCFRSEKFFGGLTTVFQCQGASSETGQPDTSPSILSFHSTAPKFSWKYIWQWVPQRLGLTWNFLLGLAAFLARRASAADRLGRFRSNRKADKFAAERLWKFDFHASYKFEAALRWANPSCMNVFAVQQSEYCQTCFQEPVIVLCLQSQTSCWEVQDTPNASSLKAQYI